MSASLAHALEQAWLRPPRWLLLLLPLEWLFALVTAMRRSAFRRGWFEVRHPGVPVVIVGNLSVGGTGKTPVVIALAQALEARELRVAVVSRGYGGSGRGVRRVGREDPAAEVGDEALMIARGIRGAVYVGAERGAAATRAADDGAGIIVSDDGLQHYGLGRDLEIVTMDADTGFGNGHLLPVGPLREAPKRLASVDFLLQRGGQDPHSGLSFEPAAWRRLHGDERRPLDDPGFGPEVHGLAGIARPGRFFDTLRSLGLLVTEHALADHQAADAALLESLGDKPLLMTAKDEVKCSPGAHGNAWVLEMRVRFPENFVEQVMERLSRKGNPYEFPGSDSRALQLYASAG